MGLDNGIMIRRRDYLPQCVSVFDEEWREKNNYDLEVAYWRKCWNVRELIYEVINEPAENDSEIELSYDDIIAIVKALRGINRKNYYYGAGSIWNWSEFKKFNRRNIRNLCKLARMTKKYPQVIPYFYDSY